MTDWGSVPDWFAAVGTVGGTLVVGGALWYEIRRRRLDDERWHGDQRSAEAAHGRLVSVTFMTTGGHDHFKIRVDNDGPGPIKQIKLALLVPEPDGGHRHIGLNDPQRTSPNLLGGRDGVTFDFFLPAGAIDPATSLDDVDAEVLFTDMTGNRWRALAINDELFRVLEDGTFKPVA